MRRSMRGTIAGLLTMGSLSIFSLSAALPAHAQTQPMDDTCSLVQVIMGGPSQCLQASTLPQHFTNVTQICNMDPAQESIIFVDDQTGRGTVIAPSTCKNFSNQSGEVNPV